MINKTAIFFLICSGCSTAHKVAAPEYGPAPSVSPPVSGPKELAGPEAPTPAVPKQSYGPAPMERKPIVLVFGPGMARAFSDLGVLKALTEEKIPIAAIFGTEFGALFGAAYSTKPNVNQLEWSFEKIKNDQFLNKTTLLPEVIRKRSSADRMDKLLKQLFAQKKIETLSPLFRANYLASDAKRSLLVEKGSVWATVRAAISISKYYGTFSLDGGEVSSAEEVYPFLIKEARDLGLGPVIVVDSWPSTSADEDGRHVAKAQLAGADLVITPRLSGVGLLDFEKRSQAVFAGKVAAMEEMETIRRLQGP